MGSFRPVAGNLHLHRKGVAVNLGFTALYNVSSALTEKLRSQEYDNLDGLITDVKKQYDIVIEAIAALD